MPMFVPQQSIFFHERHTMFSSLHRWSQCNKLALKVTCVVFGGLWEETATQRGYISDRSALSFSLPLPSSPVSYPPSSRSLVYFEDVNFQPKHKMCCQVLHTGLLSLWFFFSFFLVSMNKWYKQPRCHRLNFQLKGLVTDNQKQDFDLWLK